jgi:hypothetical protein
LLAANKCVTLVWHTALVFSHCSNIITPLEFKMGKLVQFNDLPEILKLITRKGIIIVVATIIIIIITAVYSGALINDLLDVAVCTE